MAAVIAWGRIVYVGGDATEWVVLAQRRADLAAVDALARMLLATRRLGGTFEVTDVSGDLEELLELVGLRGELGRQPERGEQVGVEEGVEPGDPVA